MTGDSCLCGVPAIPPPRASRAASPRPATTALSAPTQTVLRLHCSLTPLPKAACPRSSSTSLPDRSRGRISSWACWCIARNLGYRYQTVKCSSATRPTGCADYPPHLHALLDSSSIATSLDLHSNMRSTPVKHLRQPAFMQRLHGCLRIYCNLFLYQRVLHTLSFCTLHQYELHMEVTLPLDTRS